jgi:hypothetical protein
MFLTVVLVLLMFEFIPFTLQDHDPLKDFCRRFGHATTVIDERLFIDGGLLNWNPIPQNPQNYTSYVLVMGLVVTEAD